ncbi:MAG: carboxypeptidase regulatory-like domain-containing protein [Chloroflexi bacterium]|nr:MAG: carboxypeptidase regulatory-like domain-containing protein [Chloroflexota bacterium]
MKRIVASIILAGAMAACGSQAAQPAPPGTGIQGMVQAGPTCPVERINSPCPPHPLAATVVVRDGTGAEVTRFHSGSDGRFKVDLRPGTYNLLGLMIGSSFLPRPIPTSVTVSAGAYTSVNVEYDSGIR